MTNGREPFDSSTATQGQFTPILGPSLSSDANQGSYFQNLPEGENSPSLQSNTGRTYSSNSPDFNEYESGTRRPSVASAATVSSQGSKSGSNRFQKQLQGIFGDENSSSEAPAQRNTPGRLPGRGPRTNSTSRGRKGSAQSVNQIDRASSPNPSRPLTPLPSSDVTPWEYQNFKVNSDCSQF